MDASRLERERWKESVVKVCEVQEPSYLHKQWTRESRWTDEHLNLLKKSLPII